MKIINPNKLKEQGYKYYPEVKDWILWTEFYEYNEKDKELWFGLSGTSSKVYVAYYTSARGVYDIEIHT